MAKCCTKRSSGHEKKEKSFNFSFFSSGGRTRTCDLRVMSPTSYRLLYPAMWTAKVRSFSKTANFFTIILHHPKNSKSDAMQSLGKERWSPVERFFTLMIPAEASSEPLMEMKGIALREA